VSLLGTAKTHTSYNVRFKEVKGGSCCLFCLICGGKEFLDVMCVKGGSVKLCLIMIVKVLDTARYPLADMSSYLGHKAVNGYPLNGMLH